MVLSQPGVNAADYQSRLHVPYLKHMMSGEVKEIRSSISVTDVIGNLDPEKFSEVLQDTCGARLLRVDASSESCQLRDIPSDKAFADDFPSSKPEHFP